MRFRIGSESVDVDDVVRASACCELDLASAVDDMIIGVETAMAAMLWSCSVSLVSVKGRVDASAHCCRCCYEAVLARAMDAKSKSKAKIKCTDAFAVDTVHL